MTGPPRRPDAGCSAYLVHLGYHLPPAPHLEAQQVVEFLRAPQAFNELHVRERVSVGPALTYATGYTRRSGPRKKMRWGGAKTSPRPPSRPRLSSPLLQGSRSGLTDADWPGHSHQEDASQSPAGHAWRDSRNLGTHWRMRKRQESCIGSLLEGGSNAGSTTHVRTRTPEPAQRARG